MTSLDAEHSATQVHASAGSLKQPIAGALRNPSYLLLTAGFFTCGFHVAFIATHLPGMVASCELPASVSAWSLALFGIVMLSHQVGGFLGAYLGGKAFEASGNYDWMWWTDAALCLMAAAVHLPIREARPLPDPAAPAAAA